MAPKYRSRTVADLRPGDHLYGSDGAQVATVAIADGDFLYVSHPALKFPMVLRREFIRESGGYVPVPKSMRERLGAERLFVNQHRRGRYLA